MSFRFRLLVLVGGATLFAATGVTAVALWREIMQSQRLLACEGAAVAADVASAAQPWFSREGPLAGAASAVAPVLQRALRSLPLVRASVVDANGQVLACADGNGSGCPAGPPFGIANAGDPLMALRHLVRGEPLEASAPILREGRTVGAVRLGYRAEGGMLAARQLAAAAAAVAGVWIVLGLLLGTVLVRRMTRPLTAVAKAVERLPSLDGVQIPVQAGTSPELLDLVTGFNRMSSRLRESREKEQKLIDSLNERVAAATEEGLRAERLATLGAIAAGFAHEMGNSLHVITGFTAAALRDLPGEHPNRGDLDAVRRETQRATALLDRFLFFARARSARPEPTSVEPLVRETLEVLRPAAAEARVTTEITIEPDLPMVRLDAHVIRQAFLNLAINAVQAMKAGGGRLRVRVLQHGHGVAIEFHDTGPGVDATVRERIFEPFFTTKPDGTGLGLAIVRQAVEAHGGSIVVESPPGAGALFRVWLPGAAAQDEAA